MAWQINHRLTQTAGKAFPEAERPVKVLDNGCQHYFLPHSPVGEIELFKTEQGFVAAAASPRPPLMDPAELPEAIRRHLASTGLQPWRLVRTDDCDEALRLLGSGGEPEHLDDEFSACPYLLELTPGVPLIGEYRLRLSERLGALLTAHQAGGPVLQLVGADGIGKRSVVAAAAERSGLQLRGEIPLRRIVFDGVLEYGIEKTMRLLNGAKEALGCDDLLVISDAHVLDMASFDVPVRDEILLRELAQLPCAFVLTAPRGPLATRNVAALPCPGLESLEEVEQMIDAAYGRGGICFEGPSLDMLAGHARVPGQGIVPGRLLYLVDLAAAMITPHDEGEKAGETAAPLSPDQEPDKPNDQPVVLTPDEVIAAASMVSQAWTYERTGGTS